MSKEKELGITANRFEDHHKYYLQKAGAIGIGWPKSDERFMGKNLDYWRGKYEQDQHLNNHPLRAFDALYIWHSQAASRLGLCWSMCDSVCCLKAVIKEKVITKGGAGHEHSEK
jgi:hypothetical protein